MPFIERSCDTCVNKKLEYSKEPCITCIRSNSYPAYVPETALNKQEGGQHYKSKAIQPIVYIHANNLGFCEGNVVKYITRHKEKNGAEDIRKVIHYCELLLELEYKYE
jgi:hypothetical protein